MSYQISPGNSTFLVKGMQQSHSIRDWSSQVRLGLTLKSVINSDEHQLVHLWSLIIAKSNRLDLSLDGSSPLILAVS